MYVPPQFRETRPEILAQAMRDIQFAALVTSCANGPQITHLPMQLCAEADGCFVLRGHVARGNPHWKLANEGPSVAIFQGPQAYISPSFYPAKKQHGKVVPTWNYICVHVHGNLEAMNGEEDLRTHLAALTLANEGQLAQPWKMEDAPDDYIAGMVRAVVGVTLKASRVDAAWKMTQHRSEADRLGTIAGLEASTATSDVAAVMRELEAKRV